MNTIAKPHVKRLRRRPRFAMEMKYSEPKHRKKRHQALHKIKEAKRSKQAVTISNSWRRPLSF